MEPEDQNLTIDIPKGIPLDTDESKKISDVLDRTNKNLSMKGKVEEKKPELTEYQAPNLDALNQAIGGDMSALKTGLFKSSLITEAIKNQSEQRQAELENRAYDKFSSDQRNLIGQANAQLQPFNEFKPPKESIGQVAGFQAAMMLFAGLIGGKGALGGMAALNAAGGMMKGYADGQKEVFEKAKQEFEENMRVVQANNSRVMEILKNNMELAKTDLQVATNKAKNDFIINGQPTIADAISKAGLPAFTQFYGNALKDMNDGLKVIDSLSGYQDLGKIGQGIGGILQEQSPESKAKTIQTLKTFGVTAADQKMIPAEWNAIKQANDVATFVAQNKDSIGLLANVLGNIGESAGSLIKNIKNLYSSDKENYSTNAVNYFNQKSQEIDSALDNYSEKYPEERDRVAAAKLASKKLFSLALADAVAVGRPTVFLERSLSSFYSPNVRPDTLIDIIKSRAQEANNRLPEAFKAETSANPPPLLTLKNSADFIKLASPKTSEISAKKTYKVNDIIEKNGKKYRVIGGDPNDPDVEEVK